MKAMLVLFAGALAGCQSWQAHAPDRNHPPPHRGPGSSAGSSGSAGSATASGMGDYSGMGEKTGIGNGIGSWYGMCEMNQRIRDARTPEERQALLARMMPDMSRESRERHLRMMRQSCQ